MHLSYWEHSSFFDRQDVVIAGCGLLGLWAAIELKQKNPLLKITILEKHTIPAGASTRNAGFACFGSPSELLYDAEKLGEDEMWRIAAMRYSGIEKTRRLLGDAAIDFDNCGGFEVFKSNDAFAGKVEAGLDWVNKGLAGITGQKQTYAWNNSALAAYGLTGFASMVENKMEGGLHSGKLVKALIAIAMQMGVNILFSTPIESWENDGDSVCIKTSAAEMKAGNLILTTNAFTSNIHNKAMITPGRGQVIVTAPIHNLQLKGTFHFDEGFYYFRNVGNRVLLGGARNMAFEEETTTSFDTSIAIQQELERFLREHILSNHECSIEHRWSGIMGFTEDKRPLVKEVERNVLAATACNGMGVALSPVLAEEIAGRF